MARDPGQALHYFLQAAESGNAVAMAFLGNTQKKTVCGLGEGAVVLDPYHDLVYVK